MGSLRKIDIEQKEFFFIRGAITDKILD